MKQKEIGIISLLTLVVLTSGCFDYDDAYKNTNEQYVIGFILHNVNASTPTTLDFNENDLAKYTYSYDYPAYTPERYVNYFWWIPPHSFIASASLVSFPAPSERTYYVFAQSPEEYRNKFGNWIFHADTDMNYQNSDNNKTDEILNYRHSEFARNIFPMPGDIEHISYGSSPYIPTSIMVGNYGDILEIWFNDYRLLRTSDRQAYLYRNLGYMAGGVAHYDDFMQVPKYNIYIKRNNNYEPLQSGNITNEIWGGAAGLYWWGGNYKFYNAESGTYLVDATIPSGYPVYNITKISAEFTIPGTDVAPPVLDSISAPKGFNINEQFSIEVEFNDTSPFSVEMFYRTENTGWVNSSTTNDIIVTDPQATKLDVKIIATDFSGNKITYEILPMLLKNIAINLSFSMPDTAIRGVPLTLRVSCTDELGINCSREYATNYTEFVRDLKGDFYINGQFIGSHDISSYEISTENLPASFSTEVRFENTTGNYLPAQASKQITLLEPTATFTGVYGDFGLDTDSDGLYDYLVIAAEVNADVAGYYEIIGTTENSYRMNLYASNFSFLNPGVSTIYLMFDGLDIYRSKYSGVYGLSEILLIDYTYSGDLTDIEKNTHQTNYYAFTDFEKPPVDLYGFTRPPGLILVNHTYEIKAQIGARNGYILGAWAALYDTVKSEFGEEEIVVFLGNQTLGDIEDGYYVIANYSWTPETSEYHILKLVMGASNDEYPDNNIDQLYIDVKIDGPDLSGFFSSPNLVVNKTTTINATIYNDGTQPSSNYTAALYYSIGPENFQLIESKNLESLDPGESAVSHFQWTPLQTGIHTLRLLINSTGDVNPDNDEYTSWIVVKDDGPDVQGFFRNEWPPPVYIVNEPGMVFVDIKNIGTQPAENVTATLYANDILVGIRNIARLDVDAKTTTNFSWTPSRAGDNELRLVVNALDDVDTSNNEAGDFVTVLVNGIDATGEMNVNSIYILDTGGTATGNMIPYSLRNNGNQTAANVTSRFYVYNPNGTRIMLAENLTPQIDYFTSPIYTATWSPETTGSHIFSLEISNQGDADYSNNIVNATTSVVGMRNVTFYVTNSTNGYVNRTIIYGIDNSFSNPFEINISGILEVPDTNLSIVVLDLNPGSESGYYAVFLNSVPSEAMKVVSERHEGMRTINGRRIYTIYANRADWNYNSTMVGMRVNMSGIIPPGTNLSMYTCPEFDFPGVKCSSSWKKENHYTQVLEIVGRHEAFAIGEPYICGDLNNDGVSNILDVTLLISYVFRNGPAPQPFWIADLNVDGVGDIFDVVTLINYAFRNGPEPTCEPTSPVTASSTITIEKPASDVVISATLDRPVAGMQFDLSYDIAKVTILGVTGTARTTGMTITNTQTGSGKRRIGIYNSDGSKNIASGSGSLFTIQVSGTDLSSLRVTPVVIDQNTKKMFSSVTVNNRLASGGGVVKKPGVGV